MFSRVKKSRHGEYLQIVESYREGGKVRQRLVMYVGHYVSIEEALRLMPRYRAARRRRATEAERVAERFPQDRRLQEEVRTLREDVDDLTQRLEALQRLVDEHPDLLGRDRGRAERHARRQREAMAERTAARAARRE